MKVIVYVQGPSDQRVMQTLLDYLLDCLRAAGVAIEFIPTEGKRRLMRQTPIKAVNILRRDPQTVVIALPHLYASSAGSHYSTSDELANALRQAFERELVRRQLDGTQFRDRFLVFCLKYDLEALVLAAEEGLASRLGVASVAPTWAKPVEDQDHERPPQRVVEELFEAHGDRYYDVIDAPLILGGARYSEIAAACPQCFKPFVAYLESLLD